MGQIYHMRFNGEIRGYMDWMVYVLMNGIRYIKNVAYYLMGEVFFSVVSYNNFINNKKSLFMTFWFLFID